MVPIVTRTKPKVITGVSQRQLRYSAPSLESRFLVKLVKLMYPLHALELRSQKQIIHTYICLLQCGEG